MKMVCQASQSHKLKPGIGTVGASDLECVIVQFITVLQLLVFAEFVLLINRFKEAPPVDDLTSIFITISGQCCFP